MTYFTLYSSQLLLERAYPAGRSRAEAVSAEDAGDGRGADGPCVVVGGMAVVPEQ